MQYGMGERKKKDAVWRQREARIILFKFNAVAERRQWSSAASIPRRKSLAKLFPHFCAANVPSLQICRLRSALWYSGVSNSSISARISFQNNCALCVWCGISQCTPSSPGRYRNPPFRIVNPPQPSGQPSKIPQLQFFPLRAAIQIVFLIVDKGRGIAFPTGL